MFIVQFVADDRLLLNKFAPFGEFLFALNSEDVLTPTIIAILDGTYYDRYFFLQILSTIRHSGTTDNLILRIKEAKSGDSIRFGIISKRGIYLPSEFGPKYQRRPGG